MKTLVVYAHPNASSFNSAVKNEVLEVLKAKGHETKVSDLYKQNFNPVLSFDDMSLNRGGAVADEVKAEQDKIRWAELVIFVSPIWWTGFPAMLKGYVDRVFTYGFAYAVGESGIQPLLAGKQALIFNTHGMPEEAYKPSMYTSFSNTIDAGIFKFSGFDVRHIYFPNIMQSTDEQRRGYLDSIKQEIDKV